MNCHLTDTARANGTRCKSFDCVPCMEFTRKNDLDDSRKAYDHLSSEYRKLNNTLTSLNEENTLLTRKLFNSEQHYDLLKQSYDLVFEYLSEANNSNKFLEFNKFMEWVRKPAPEKEISDYDESVTAYELFMKTQKKEENKGLPYCDSHC